MSQVIQSGITSLELELHHICQLGIRALDPSKADTALYMSKNGPYSAQVTDNVLKKIWGKRMAGVLHLIFYFCLFGFSTEEIYFCFFFCCPELYLCESFSAVFVLREVTCLYLEGSYWVVAIASQVDFSQQELFITFQYHFMA